LGNIIWGNVVLGNVVWGNIVWGTGVVPVSFDPALAAWSSSTPSE
jgi:hypothetical protein